MDKLIHFSLLAFIMFTAVSCQSIKAMSQLEALYHVAGSSMEPSYPDGTTLGINNDAYTSNLPKRGDIVVIKNPTTELLLIKRVVGLPNESVEMKDGELSINGTIIEEFYVDSPAQYIEKWDLGENEYVVLGNNRNASSDSHTWGALSFDNIIGKAEYVCSNRNGFSCTTEIKTVIYPELE